MVSLRMTRWGAPGQPPSKRQNGHVLLDQNLEAVVLVEGQNEVDAERSIR